VAQGLLGEGDGEEVVAVAPKTPVQQRWSETQRAPTSPARVFNFFR